MKLKLNINLNVTTVLLILAFIWSIWYYSLFSLTTFYRKPACEEFDILYQLASKKEYSQRLLNNVSNKAITEDVRNHYEQAKMSYNSLIELFLLGTDNGYIPVDSIAYKLTIADSLLKLLQQDFPEIRVSDFSGINCKNHTQGNASMADLTSQPEIYLDKESVNAILDIFTQRGVYDRLAKRVEHYRWDPLPANK